MDPRLFYQCNDCNAVLLELNATLTEYCHQSQAL